MRSYGQYCALAKVLDVVGDRWSLLVVRELLLGPCRYGELLDGLPGVATNLLTDRLRSLEEAGVLERDGHGRYALTPWGQGLAEPLYSLARWGAPLMAEMGEGEAFRSHWLAHPVAVIFGGRDTSRPPLVVEIRTGDTPVTMESAGGVVGIRTGAAAAPDLVVSGPPDAVIGLLAGRLDEAEASARGVSVLGDAGRLAQLRTGEGEAARSA